MLAERRRGLRGVEAMQIKRVGVIGLGNMGLPMATTLDRKGFEVVGFDLSDPRRKMASEQGIEALPLDELLRSVDVVVSSLPYAATWKPSSTPPARCSTARIAG